MNIFKPGTVLRWDRNNCSLTWALPPNLW